MGSGLKTVGSGLNFQHFLFHYLILVNVYAQTHHNNYLLSETDRC